MKQAYVSIVLFDQENNPDWTQIKKIDGFLSDEVRRHEIILVTKKPFFDVFAKPLSLNGPLSIVIVHSTASTNDLIIAGLGRSVGDFVIEWHLNTSIVESGTIASLLTPSDEGNELLECVPIRLSLGSQIFYKLVNKLRTVNKSVRPSLVRVYSRRALNWLLEASRYESQVVVLAAELPFQKAIRTLPIQRIVGRGARERILEGFALLTKGSRFGTVVPLLLAGISSLFAISVAIYALTVFIVSGNAAEGWTSIAVVMGFGQGAILALVGLTWSRLDSLAYGLSKRNDATVSTEVYPAKIWTNPISQNH